jgi:hypothetical protein
MGCGASAAQGEGSEAVLPKPTTTVRPEPSSAMRTAVVKPHAAVPEPSRASSSGSTARDAGLSAEHFYCGLPGAAPNRSLLGSDPHQAGWLAGKWTSCEDDRERTDALRKLGILLTVSDARARAALALAPLPPFPLLPALPLIRPLSSPRALPACHASRATLGAPAAKRRAT